MKKLQECDTSETTLVSALSNRSSVMHSKPALVLVMKAPVWVTEDVPGGEEEWAPMSHAWLYWLSLKSLQQGPGLLPSSLVRPWLSGFPVALTEDCLERKAHRGLWRVNISTSNRFKVENPVENCERLSFWIFFFEIAVLFRISSTHLWAT